MGYDLHITRKEDWTLPDGPAIGEEEFKKVIAENSELAIHIHWFNGEIVAKNPDEVLIPKLVQLAQKLGAKAQGDDGEIYHEDGSSTEPQPFAAAPSPGLLGRITGWFAHRRMVKKLQTDAGDFRVGQRVKNPWGVVATVVAVNKNANGGLGVIRVRQDNGSEQEFAYIASALKPLDQ